MPSLSDLPETFYVLVHNTEQYHIFGDFCEENGILWNSGSRFYNYASFVRRISESRPVVFLCNCNIITYGWSIFDEPLSTIPNVSDLFFQPRLQSNEAVLLEFLEHENIKEDFVNLLEKHPFLVVINVEDAISHSVAWGAVPQDIDMQNWNDIEHRWLKLVQHFNLKDKIRIPKLIKLVENTTNDYPTVPHFSV